MVSRFVVRFAPALTIVLMIGASAHAQQQPQTAFALTIRGHQFDPAELTVPANTRIQLTVRNLDPTPAEFESTELRREKVIPANGEAVVPIGPLRPGRYRYFDDFHRDSTGVIVAQ